MVRNLLVAAAIALLIHGAKIYLKKRSRQRKEQQKDDDGPVIDV
jgi:hypothetical protein